MGEEIENSLLAKETSVGEEETRIIDGNEELSLKRRVWIETKKIWVVAAPATFTRVVTFGTNIISQAFIGHIGSTQLAAFSLVFTVLVRFANGILQSQLLWLESRSLEPLKEDEMAFDNLYCVAFPMMDAQWLVKRSSYMDFNDVMKSMTSKSERELALEDVASVKDLPAYNLLRR